MILIILVVVLWWLVGLLGFIFWCTREFDFESNDVLPACFISIIGPLTFIVGFFIPFIRGFFIYSENEENKIIFKKR